MKVTVLSKIQNLKLLLGTPDLVSVQLNLTEDFNKQFMLVKQFILFQMADGNMVHEKTSADRVGFYLSSALITVGMGMTLKFYYDFAFPKKA